MSKHKYRSQAAAAFYLNKTNKSKHEIIGRILRTAKCGRAIAINFLHDAHIEVYFVATGYVARSTKGNLKAKRPQVCDPLARTVCGVGYKGVGKYDSLQMSYSRWMSMLKRCYYRKGPTYDEVNVCPEWHEYQVFAKWFYDNYPTDGVCYDLDKDIAMPGNKVYGPKFCTFVTPQENNAAGVRIARKPHRTPMTSEQLAEKIRLACAASEWTRTARLRRAPEFTL